MNGVLRISDSVELPVEYVTKTSAILAQRRKGKTYTASVIAEELVEEGLPWVALDPTGAWWGLRSSADGDRAGLPVVILGGPHGDAPLERTSGRYVAELIVEHPGWYVLDLSLFESKAAEREFAADFGEALYRRKGQPGRDFPLHLFVDEADLFVPQDRERGDLPVLGAFQSIVRRGGLRGLGTTLVSQRPALVNKSVLVQLDMLIVLRLVAGNDQDYIDKNYISRSGSSEQRTELMGSMASLRLGEAWVWEPGADPPLFERVQIRQRHTFNSSATPKPGERRIEPRRLADVDLDAVKEAMADTIERAKADDPKELRKRIGELERQLRDAPVEREVAEVERVVEIVPGELIAGVNSARRLLLDFAENATRLSADMEAAEQRALDRPGGDRSAARKAPSTVGGERRGATPTAPIRTSASEPVVPAPGSDAVQLPVGEHKILTAAAQYPAGVTREQLTVLTGYKRSSRDTYVQRLRQRGYADTTTGRIVATDAGVAALGNFEPLPTGEALQAYWLDRLPEGERRILEILIGAWPDGVDRDEISERTSYKRSSRDTYLQRLRSRQLVTTDGQPRAADVLFEETADAKW